MESQGNYKRCQTLEDQWKLFSFQCKTTEDGTEPMVVEPLEDQEEAMEVEPVPTELVGHRSAEPRLCLKKGARRAGRVWPHPRLYRSSSSAVVSVQEDQQCREVTLKKPSSVSTHPVLGTRLISRVCRRQRIRAFLRALLLQ